MENKENSKKHYNLFYIICENIEKLRVPTQIYNDILLLVKDKVGNKNIESEEERHEKY